MCMDVRACFIQLTRDFVHDCKHQIATYFVDSSRECRVADRLEEELVHHSSVLGQCNADNTALRPLAHDSDSQLQLSMSAASASVSTSVILGLNIFLV